MLQRLFLVITIYVKLCGNRNPKRNPTLEHSNREPKIYCGDKLVLHFSFRRRFFSLSFLDLSNLDQIRNLQFKYYLLENVHLIVLPFWSKMSEFHKKRQIFPWNANVSHDEIHNLLCVHKMEYSRTKSIMKINSVWKYKVTFAAANKIQFKITLGS